LVLAVLAVLPALGLVAFTAKQNRDTLARQVEESSLRLARLASGEHERAIEGARQLLTGIARIPEIQKGGTACAGLLADMLIRFPSYANFGAADLHGDIFCSAVPTSTRTNIGDRAYYRDALVQRDFSIGDFQIGRITGIPTLTFGYPILNARGRTTAVVFAALSLESLGDVTSRAQLPAGSSAIVLDRNGVILARSPDPAGFVGRSIPRSPLAREMLSRNEGTAVVVGPDGIRRVYGFERLRGGGRVSVAVGVPTAIAFADVNRTYHLTLLALGTVGVLAIVAAWIIGTVFVVRPVVRTFELERAARERLEVIDQMRSDFVSMVSHELRNPMATIRGFGQILRDKPGVLAGEKRQDAYDVIVRQVDRMSSLVDNVLEVSRMESDTFSYAFIPHDLRGLLAECVEEARASWPGHPITLEAPKKLPRAKGDRERLKQVFANLLSNACRYSGFDGAVVVRVRRGDGTVRVDISDQGVGISPEHQSMLFQRFARVRTPDTANVRGTGLGLYISRRIVEAHGGRISVDSEPGRGSTFMVEVPVDPGTPPEPGVAGNGDRP
jgi:signal transduction histidine kinase